MSIQKTDTMRLCEDVRTARRHLDKLKAAYKAHMAVKGSKRLAWMERQIDMSEDELKAARALRGAAFPAGCLGCGMYGACPYSE